MGLMKLKRAVPALLLACALLPGCKAGGEEETVATFSRPEAAVAPERGLQVVEEDALWKGGILRADQYSGISGADRGA